MKFIELTKRGRDGEVDKPIAINPYYIKELVPNFGRRGCFLVMKSEDEDDKEILVEETMDEILKKIEQ